MSPMFTVSDAWADAETQAAKFAEFHARRQEGKTRERTPAELTKAAEDSTLIFAFAGGETVAVGGLFLWGAKYPELGGFRTDKAYEGWGLQALLMRSLIANAHAFGPPDAPPFCAVTTPDNGASIASIRKCGLVEADPERERLDAIGLRTKRPGKLFFLGDLGSCGSAARTELRRIVQMGQLTGRNGAMPVRFDIAVVRTGHLRHAPA
jgi:GNAT superfamily N-acetyltransferase